VSREAERDRIALLVHEVRSSVAAIAAITEALTSDRLDEPSTRELVALAIAACRGIERVVGDAALGSVRLEGVDPTRLVRAAVATAALGNARVRAAIAPALPEIEADPQRLRQALDNLIANALTHSSSQSEVVVGARTHAGELVLSVSDAGQGIPVDDQSRIFDPGIRLDMRRPGSGLGLAVARAIAESHGGSLSVESAPGHGATFTIALPLEGR
jgi:signal transduction histidine kinase